jgi:hypothetical protein
MTSDSKSVTRKTTAAKEIFDSAEVEDIVAELNETEPLVEEFHISFAEPITPKIVLALPKKIIQKVKK